MLLSVVPLGVGGWPDAEGARRGTSATQVCVVAREKKARGVEAELAGANVRTEARHRVVRGDDTVLDPLGLDGRWRTRRQ
jgi:hypothetical protein